MFTCCKNTFPNFNITRSHFQTFIHSFLVRWLDVSAKRKKNRKKKRSSDLCTNEGKEGRAVSKNAGGCSTFWGRKTWDEGHETEGDCWRICVHLNPEREKVTNSHHNFLLFCRQTTPVSATPSPYQPHWSSSGAVKDDSRAPGVVMMAGQVSHPRVKYQLLRREHAHCAYLIATYTHCRADLNY